MLLANKNKRIGTIVLTLIVLFATQSLFAVTRKGKHSGNYSNNSIANSWSIQFALENSYDNDEFDGVRFSVQKMLNRTSAVKFSLGVFDNLDDPFNNTVFYNDGVSFEFNDWNRKSDEVNLSLQFVNYPNYNNSFNLYWGVGPRLSFTEADYDPDVYVDVPSRMEWVDYADFNSVNLVGLGMEANLGGELFLGNNFSLFGEYGFIIENRWYIFDVDYYNDGGYHDHQIERFNDGSHTDWSRLKLGFAVHF